MSPQICLIFNIVIGLGFVTAVQDGLYNTDDNDVVPLSDKAFKSKIKDGNPNLVWVVEFYNSWCGHCISFAPTWKQVASHFKNWSDLVVVAAMDCSQPQNLETCRKYDINVYPTIKMLPPVNVKNGQIELLESQELQTIKKLVLGFMVKNAPRSWPRLKPVKAVHEVMRDKKDFHEHMIVVAEEENSPIGIQVILDLRKTENVLVRRMLRNETAKYGIRSFPSLHRVNPDSTLQVLATGTKMMANDRTDFVHTIKNLAKGIVEDNSQGAELDGPKSNLGTDHRRNIPSHSVHYDSSVVRMQDLESALHYSLRQEVAIRQIIDGERLSALKRFVRVLARHFPGRKSVIGFLGQVFEMLDNLTTDRITGEEWLDRINKLQNSENFLPEVIKWESCQGSSARYRGYPCAMWVLYHTLTAADYNLNKAARHTNHHEVLGAIRDYMKYFFGCHECSRNFQLMATTLEDDIHDHQSAVLWLWSAHNKANRRLHGDASEDPKHLKIQFPSQDMCPECHRERISENESVELKWDPKSVVKFLVNMYSESSIVSSEDLGIVNKGSHDPASTNNLSAKSSELDWWENKQNNNDLKRVHALLFKKVRSGTKDDSHPDVSVETTPKQQVFQLLQLWGITQIDFSMCIFFYCTSTFILIALYYHFIVRRRMKPCKNIKSLLPL